MTGWIVVIVLYVAGMGFFHLLGGLSAAGQAFERWGRETAERRRRAQRLPKL